MVRVALPKGATGGPTPLGGGDSTAFRVCGPALQATRLRDPGGTRGPLPCHYSFLSSCPRHLPPPCPRGDFLHGQHGVLLVSDAPGGEPRSPPALHDSRGRPDAEVWLACLGYRSDETCFTLPFQSLPPLFASKCGLMFRPVWGPGNSRSMLSKFRPTVSHRLRPNWPLWGGES